MVFVLKNHLITECVTSGVCTYYQDFRRMYVLPRLQAYVRITKTSGICRHPFHLCSFIQMKEQIHLRHLKHGNIVLVTVKGKLLKLLVLIFQCIFSIKIDQSFSLNLSTGTRINFCYMDKGFLGLKSFNFAQLSEI